MKPLFACWNEVAPRLASSRLIALFLDFDGTLVDIRPRPDMVHVHPEARRALAALARNPRFRVWVISARRRDDVRAHLRVPAVRYLGLYGWERDGGQSTSSGAIGRVRAALNGSLPHHQAIWVEDKQHTFAVHYRGAPEPVRRAAAERVFAAVEAWSGYVRVAPGKCVWEIVPLELGDKGLAVRREIAGLPGPALPVYIGDDLSDEAAFAALETGLAIRVGFRRLTRARYRLDGAAGVYEFLERLRDISYQPSAIGYQPGS